MLGALDPVRVIVEQHERKTMILDESTLVVTLMKSHLVRLLRVASSLQVLDSTTFAIQVSLSIPVCNVETLSRTMDKLQVHCEFGEDQLVV